MSFLSRNVFYYQYSCNRNYIISSFYNNSITYIRQEKLFHDNQRLVSSSNNVPTSGSYTTKRTEKEKEEKIKVSDEYLTNLTRQPRSDEDISKDKDPRLEKSLPLHANMAKEAGFTSTQINKKENNNVNVVDDDDDNTNAVLRKKHETKMRGHYFGAAEQALHNKMDIDLYDDDDDDDTNAVLRKKHETKMRGHYFGAAEQALHNKMDIDLYDDDNDNNLKK